MALQQRCVDGVINGLLCPVGPSTPTNAQQRCAAVAHDLHRHTHSGNKFQTQKCAQLVVQQCWFALLRGDYTTPGSLLWSGERGLLGCGFKSKPQVVQPQA